MEKFINRPSPNFDERDLEIGLRYIVLHYTGMPVCEEALQRLCDPQSKVSAHYLVDEKGAIYRLVDETKRAWHAGKGSWNGITDINSASIGIELANPGHEFGYVPFPAPQISALKDLLRGMLKRYGMNSVTALLGHSDIAPDRKQDPGELFPWQDLAKSGLGYWPDVKENDSKTAATGEVLQWLQKIGYECPDEGAVKPALLAFQRRYDPERLTGAPEPETIARLRRCAGAL